MDSTEDYKKKPKTVFILLIDHKNNKIRNQYDHAMIQQEITLNSSRTIIYNKITFFKRF